MAKYIQKISNFFAAYKQNGGIIGSYMSLYRTDELKWGKLVGEDKYGNKYFENNYFFVGRNRWVTYPLSVNMDYDGSQVPAEWHRWLHYTCDDPPTVVPPVKHRWLQDHRQNMAGTSEEYVPYSTTTSKIQSWVPPKK